LSLRKTAISGIGWTFANQFGIQIISFFVSVIMTRLLIPSEFGLIGMISVLVAIGTSLINSGLTHSLIRTSVPDQSDYSTVFYFNLAGSILVYCIIFFCSPLVAGFFSQPILVNIIRVYCLTFIINAFSEVQVTKLTKEMSFKIQMIVSIPSLILAGLLGILLAYKGFGVWSLVWMSVSQAVLNTIQLWIRTGWSPSLIFNMEKFKYHFHFGYKITLAGLLNTFFNNIYQVIIGRKFMPAQVGYYARADSLKQLPVANIAVALNKVTYSLFASIQHDDVRLKKAYKEIMQMVIFIVAPVLVFMGVLAEPLFRFLFTDKWLPAVPYFQILCIAGILYPVHEYNLNILNVKGRSDLLLYLEVIKKILIIVIIFITIKFGIIALIWGQAINSVFAFFINSHYSGKFIHYNSWQQVKDIFPLIFIAVFSGAIVWFIDYSVKMNNDLLRLLAGSTIGIIFYLSISALFKTEALLTMKELILSKTNDSILLKIIKDKFSIRG